MKNYKTPICLFSIFTLAIFMIVSCAGLDEPAPPSAGTEINLFSEHDLRYIVPTDLTESDIVYFSNTIPQTEFATSPFSDMSETEYDKLPFSDILADNGVNREKLNEYLEPLFNEEAVFTCLPVAIEEDGQLVAFRPQILFQAALIQAQQEEMSLDIQNGVRGILDQYTVGDESVTPTPSSASCGHGVCIGPMVGGPESGPTNGPRVCSTPADTNPDSDE